MEKNKRTALLLVSLLSAIFLASLAPIGTKAVSESYITATAIKDAYIDESAPSTNFNLSELLVRTAGYPTQNARSYLGFDLSVIPPAAIVSASLKVYVTTPPTAPRKYEVDIVHGTWNESAITWNSQPWMGFRCSTVKVNATTGWVSFDVTQAIRGYVNRWYSVEGFVIRDEMEYDGKGPIGTRFASREYQDQNLRPVLTITVSYDPDFQMAAWPDMQTTYPGGIPEFWSDVRSVNLFEGDMSMNVSGLHPTMSADIQPRTFHLSAGDVRGVRVRIITSPDTPSTSYAIRIIGKNDGIEHYATVTLEVKAALILRDLPSSAANGTDIRVTLRYTAGVIGVTGLIIEEWLPRFVNYTSHQLSASFGATAFSQRTYEDGRTLVKWILANRTAFSSFVLNYTAHFAVIGGQMQGDLWFWGRYQAVDASGQTYSENILGDQRVEVAVGLPGPWDDDGRVNDWELLQVINLWTSGGLSDLELLAYVDLWSQTWWL